jgi:hypothetical protein
MGSFNFTFQARKNYEALVRIDDQSVIDAFYAETERLIEEPFLAFRGVEMINGAARCNHCQKLLSEKEIADADTDGYGGSLYYCRTCASLPDREFY